MRLVAHYPLSIREPHAPSCTVDSLTAVFQKDWMRSLYLIRDRVKWCPLSSNVYSRSIYSQDRKNHLRATCRVRFVIASECSHYSVLSSMLCLLAHSTRALSHLIKSDASPPRLTSVSTNPSRSRSLSHGRRSVRSELCKTGDDVTPCHLRSS